MESLLSLETVLLVTRCPWNTATATEFPCPDGTHSTHTNLTDAGDCTDCPVGYWCGTGDTAPDPCAAGTYTNVTNTGSGSGSGDCSTCPAGYYCPSATDDLLECATGYYSADGAGRLHCL